MRLRSFLRRLGHRALWAGGLALAVGTIYLAIVAFLWHAQVGELTDTRLDLKGQLSDEEATLEDATADLEAAQARLEETLTSLSGLADDKAQAEDFQYLLKDVALAMADCANESGELLGYVYNRDLYTTQSLWDWEYAVWDYYYTLSLALTDLAAEAEGAFS